MTFNPVLPSKFKPAVRKVWLQLVAGLVWSGVGVMLIGFASRWLKPVPFFTLLILASAGLILAAAIYFYGFSRLAKKNIKRISRLKGEKICVFAFQGWTSYPLVIFMIFLGIYLRIFSSFPKPLLAILYLGIGGGLLAASLLYFEHIAQTYRPKFSEA